MIWSTLPIGLRIVGLPAGVIVNPRHSLMMDSNSQYPDSGRPASAPALPVYLTSLGPPPCPVADRPLRSQDCPKATASRNPPTRGFLRELSRP